jgi:hypothetical protein
MSIAHALTWPADRVHLLQPYGLDGDLFTSPDGQLYAHVEGEGHILVERQSDGRYQIPFGFSPQLPGPFLSKSERQPTWKIERPAWLTQGLVSDPLHTVVVDPPRPEAPTYLAPADAARLTPAAATPDGIRYDKHRKTYVDTAEGTVMVRKNAAGEYQQAFAAASNSPDVYFERIAHSRLWRHKTREPLPLQEAAQQDRRRPASEIDEPTPGPSKRTRLEDDASDSHSLAESLLSANPQALNLSFGMWRNWGKTLRPSLGQHIKIDGLHYRIVPQTLKDNSRLVYLQHPLFSPALYDAFEFMLRDNPSLQPKWAVKKDNRWIVLEWRVPFEMPITQYISRTFRYLSDQSVNSLARAMFNHANRSQVINAHGLAIINQTFRYWLDRNVRWTPRSDTADPLLMLRSLADEQGRGHGASIAIPAMLGEGLQRLDLDPGRFPHHWNDYATAPTPDALRTLFSKVLVDDGYTVIAALHPFASDALLFHRETLDALFILKLPALVDGRLTRPTVPTPAVGDLLLQLRSSAQQPTLPRARETNTIINLLGGVQTDALGQPTLFIIKEH